jgi:hypothetical protein
LKNQGQVPPHQLGERGLVAAGAKAAQQAGIVWLGRFRHIRAFHREYVSAGAATRQEFS